MTAAISPDALERRLAEVTERLAEEFAGTFGYETVARMVEESAASLSSARVLEFLPVLTYRFARERLRAQAQLTGMIAKTNPEVLFVCVHNAGRSQMAALLTSHLSGGAVHVRSAGSAPADQVNPAVIAVMEELGLDLSHEFPKPLTDDVVEAADVVITMGCGDACPVYPGKRYLDWEVDDPAGQTIPTVRRIRDDIRARVEDLLRELGIEPSHLP
jgi:protein-tyrosine-phosphatase